MDKLRQPPPPMDALFHRRLGGNHESKDRTDADDGAKNIAEELADRGDVLGLLGHLEDRLDPLGMEGSVPLISRCIRQKARHDLSGLCDAAFARVIGLALLLQTRAAMHITRTLAEAEQRTPHRSGLPADLIDGGWVERAERLGRFLAEMAQLRARVGHVNQLNERNRPPQHDPGEFNGRWPLGRYRDEAASGEEHPANGGLRRQTGRFEFP